MGLAVVVNAMDVDDGPLNRGDLTREQMHARAVELWNDTARGYATERTVVEGKLRAAATELDGLASIAGHNPAAEIRAIELLQIVARYERRLGDIDAAIAAHRKAKP